MKARKDSLKPISAIAAKFGIPEKHLQVYGDYKAKLSLELLRSKPARKNAKYVVVTGITPTPYGEGKTVTTIGLSMAINRRGKRCVACIRQPSIGPVFGIKGGGSGGGKSRVIPTDEVNLHLTGDIHAVETAHNLAAAFLDNHLYRGNSLGIDLEKIFWHRVVDINDRSLRKVRIGIGGGANGVERQTRFDITVSSELMAILALAESLADLRKRAGRIVVAFTRNGRPVTCEDLRVAGAMAALLKDAIKPNLLQTSENTPCLIHAGPFANIAHGNSSILADRMGLALADFVVTESGFGADCGLEKFINIKCRLSRLKPNCAVLVCSARALKMHSRADSVEDGCANLEKQIENVRIFGVPCVVAINKFPGDTERDLNIIRKAALACGAFDCVISDLYRLGSAGGVELAKAVEKACLARTKFSFLYPLEMPIKAKINAIAKSMYGAKGVSYEPLAEERITLYQRLGYGSLPVCIAKTHLSLSHDPKLKNRPQNFTLPISDIRPSIGAGFLYALCGKMLTMPGLPEHPRGEEIDIDSKGNVTGMEA